jgi:hypothetical protein
MQPTGVPIGRKKPSKKEIEHAASVPIPQSGKGKFKSNPNLKTYDFGQAWGGVGGKDTETYGKPLSYTLNGFNEPLNKLAVPGTMVIEEPPRPMRCDELTRHRKRTHVDCDEGSKLGNITRIITDQRVFQRKLKKKKGGGTVLFDMSGSMGALTEIIDEVISNNKTATTCATYSGMRSSGVLRIIVKAGTRVVPDQMGPPCGYNNIVDIPALDWLTRQPAPRVWVSDQCVTGVVGVPGGSSAGNQLLLEAAHKMCESFNITILDSPREVADHLQKCWEGEKSTGINPNAYEDNS